MFKNGLNQFVLLILAHVSCPVSPICARIYLTCFPPCPDHSQNFLNESIKYLDKAYPTNGAMVSSSIDKHKMDNDKK